MNKAVKQAPQTRRRKTAVEWGVQVALLMAVIAGITAWQTRHMVGSGEPAPAFELTDLNGQRTTLSGVSGRKVVLYFFAPWCSVCHASSGNVNALREAHREDELAIYAVGLGWESVSELRQFSRQQELSVPVLIGTDRVASAYRVSSFPSVYILDGEHRIAHRLVGYTTSLGLRIRTALTGLF